MTFNKIFAFICGILVVINVTFFIKGVHLGDEISNYEKELKVLQQQNAEYEHQIYSLESISKTASIAAELKYGKYNEPIFTDMPQYAFNK